MAVVLHPRTSFFFGPTDTPTRGGAVDLFPGSLLALPLLPEGPLRDPPAKEGLRGWPHRGAPPQSDKALIAIMTYKGGRTTGCEICLPQKHPRGLRPIPPLHLLRKGPPRPDPLSASRHLAADPGPDPCRGKITPVPFTCSFNVILKAIVTRLCFNGGPKSPPTPHAFRRGETQAIKDSGLALSVIIKSGTRAHSGYRAYLDLEADYAINISRLIIDALGSDSDDRDPKEGKTTRKIRKRVKGAPVALVDANKAYN